MCAPFIFVFLAKIFNNCIDIAYFPDSCRIAKIIAIFKDGSKQNVRNYRPISLLTVFSKIFEKLLHKNIVFYQEHKTIIPEQFGFRENYSCIHAIARVTEFMRKTVDQKYMGLAPFIDLKKAFDTVDHSILLEKFNDLILSFLTKRQQYD